MSDHNKFNKAFFNNTDWIDFDDAFKTIKDCLDNRDWNWYANCQCKYLKLTIDMRNGSVALRDRDGTVISLEQLKYQHKADLK